LLKFQIFSNIYESSSKHKPKIQPEIQRGFRADDTSAQADAETLLLLHFGRQIEQWTLTRPLSEWTKLFQIISFEDLRL